MSSDTDRAERLRKRRQQSTQPADDGDEEEAEQEHVEEHEAAEDDESDDVNPKEDWHAVGVYLPDDLDAKLHRRFKELDLEAETEHGESLEKLKQFYPAVVEKGLEHVHLDDVRER